MTDEALAELAQRGDPSAMDALLGRRRAEMRRWALFELGDTSLADDATQEASLRVLRAIGAWIPGRAFGPWLRALVKAACADQRRSEQRAERRRELPRQATSPDRTIDLARGVSLALDAFAELTPRQREVYWLCQHEGRAPSDVVVELGIEPSTARVLLHQARQRVRARVLGSAPELLELVRDA